MKRSEMVKVLRDSFVKHMNPNGPANNDYLMYSFILRDLEEAGMLPPEIDSGIFCREDCSNYWVSEWEPEDEKN